MKPTIEEQAETYAISRMGELMPSWDDDKKLWHRRNIDNCRDYFIAGFKAAQGVNEEIINEVLKRACKCIGTYENSLTNSIKQQIMDTPFNDLLEKLK